VLIRVNGQKKRYALFYPNKPDFVSEIVPVNSEQLEKIFLTQRVWQRGKLTHRQPQVVLIKILMIKKYFANAPKVWQSGK
jgi:hypothetical protein